MDIGKEIIKLNQQYADLAVKKQECHTKMLEIKATLRKLEVVRKHAEGILDESEAHKSLREVTDLK